MRVTRWLGWIAEIGNAHQLNDAFRLGAPIPNSVTTHAPIMFVNSGSESLTGKYYNGKEVGADYFLSQNPVALFDVWSKARDNNLLLATRPYTYNSVNLVSLQDIAGTGVSGNEAYVMLIAPIYGNPQRWWYVLLNIALRRDHCFTSWHGVSGGTTRRGRVTRHTRPARRSRIGSLRCPTGHTSIPRTRCRCNRSCTAKAAPIAG